MHTRKSITICFIIALLCLATSSILFGYAIQSTMVLLGAADGLRTDPSSAPQIEPKALPGQADEVLSPSDCLTESILFQADDKNQINPYEDIELTYAEKELLACMVYNEARGEPFKGQVAVVQVALNRYMHEAFNGSISDILLAPSQFSVGNTYGEEQMEAVEAALAGEPVLDLNTDVVFFSTGKLTYGSYYKTIGGHVFRTYF